MCFGDRLSGQMEFHRVISDVEPWSGKKSPLNLNSYHVTSGCDDDDDDDVWSCSSFVLSVPLNPAKQGQ